MKQAVLFDCDGVLINSEVLADRAQADVLARYGLFYTPSQFMEYCSGMGRDERFARFSADHQSLYGAPLPPAVRDELEDAYEDFMAKYLEPTEGMAAFLECLRVAGIPYAVASNSAQDRLEDKLRHVGLYDAFAPHIYGIDHVQNPKPAPDIFQHAAARLGRDAADCVIVEDSLVGLAAALAAGGHVIGFAANCSDPAFAAPRLAAAGAHDTARTMEDLAVRIASALGLVPTPLPVPPPPVYRPAPRPPQP